MPQMNLFHIPVCPFSQRVEILVTLLGRDDAVQFHRVDITAPRPQWLLDKTQGSSALPILELENGRVIKESMVILRYMLDRVPNEHFERTEPWERAVQNMLIAKESAFVSLGYRFVMNQELADRQRFRNKMLSQYQELDAFLRQYAPAGPWLFDDFGLPEVVFTPFFMRFWFLEYYEGFELPRTSSFDRVRSWREACLSHPAAQQVSREEIVKVYYDYAMGFGNGALPPGRSRSSFVFDPPWQDRPWPPANKYEHAATDQELGLLPS